MEGMARVSRIRFTPRQKVELWERWKSGQCVADIARALERRNKSGVYRLLALTGGIAPPPRRRAPLALSLEEREEISRGIAAGRSMRQIAVGLGRCPSTVSRELGRNGGRAAYRASEADQSAWERAGRPKLCRLATHPELRWRVAGKLALQWSPQQISAWLRRAYAGEEELQISHETIYRSLFVQARGVLKKELMVHLRTRRQLRQVKGGTTKIGLGSIVDAISIRERPAEVEDRAVPGHWEGDLLSGAKNTHIATLVERHTRFVMLIKLDGKDTTSVVEALARIRAVLGSAAATRTPTGCCASTSRRGRISPSSRRRISTGSRYGSTSDLGRPWVMTARPIDYVQCCNDRLNPPPKRTFGSIL